MPLGYENLFQYLPVYCKLLTSPKKLKAGGGVVNIVSLFLMSVRYLVKKEHWKFKQPTKRLRGQILVQEKSHFPSSRTT